ncbi:FecR domain-containing protein [Sphingomonas sp. R647]|uniref:FecR family protein n=1 Tax=Sphingomonas sp. R647 TaxID=2875233 RepID=UPI001CD38C5D|nr:FecR domain-containing protein [Sphingomonas sp. R647]MCA1196495.1 FecR domain-containing protein [Sphingomonas sp. R647]
MSGDVRAAAAAWWSAMRGPDASARRAAFEAWLDADAAHRREYARVEQAWEAAAALGASDLGRARTLRRHRPRWMPQAPAVGLAATACALLLALFLLWPQGALQQTGTAQLLTLRSAVGEVRTHRLPDGSRITLDTDSAVAVRFDATTRRVELLKGRARFEVRPDPARNFVAQAAGVAIGARDAQFDAQIRADGLCLTSLRGGLDVRPVAGGPGGAAFQLASQQRVLVGPSGQPRAAPVPAGKGSAQWVAGMLVFERAPLAQVLAQTNRYSQRQILLDQPALGALGVTGSFRPLPVEGLARALAAAFDLEVRQGEDGNLILARP